MGNHIIAGKYTVLQEIGQGGMGKVYKAQHLENHSLVAIKIISQGVESQGVIARFEREAKIMSSLSHPNIVSFYEMGIHAEKPFLVMEFIEGISLTEKVFMGKGFSFRRKVETLIKIAQAVHYAHTKGVVHRDLKPSNIMVDQNDEPKVMDFGLAKMKNTTQLTQRHALLGSLPFMPPEQAEGRVSQINALSDVYSLGIILYVLLTEQLPFTGSSSEIIKQIKETRPPAPSSINPKAPKILEKICLKALSKKKNQRQQSADEFAQELSSFFKKRTPKQQNINVKNPVVIFTIVNLLAIVIFISLFANRAKETKSVVQKSIKKSIKKSVKKSAKKIISHKSSSKKEIKKILSLPKKLPQKKLDLQVIASLGFSITKNMRIKIKNVKFRKKMNGYEFFIRGKSSLHSHFTFSMATSKKAIFLLHHSMFAMKRHRYAPVNIKINGRFFKKNYLWNPVDDLQLFDISHLLKRGQNHLFIRLSPLAKTKYVLRGMQILLWNTPFIINTPTVRKLHKNFRWKMKMRPFSPKIQEAYYKGGLKNGQPWGIGKCKLNFRRSYNYLGQWKNAIPHGIGIYTKQPHYLYIGEIRKGRYHGRGHLYYKHGEYMGPFRNGLMSGHGKVIFRNGQIYVGKFYNNAMNGKGTYRWKNGNKLVTQFKKGIPSGHAKYTWKNGGVYEGQFHNWKRNGQGKMRYPDGTLYIGKFQNDKKNGYGKMYHVNGQLKHAGRWQNNVFIGK